MKKIMIILMVMMLMSCSSSEVTLIQSLTLKEVDLEVIQVKNDLIKNLLRENTDITESYPAIYNNLDLVTFESITGSESETEALIKGDILLNLNGEGYKGSFMMNLKNQTLESFEVIGNNLIMDRPLNLFSYDGLDDYMDLDKENKSLTLKKNDMAFTYYLEDLVNFEVIDVTYNVVEQTYVETVSLYFVNAIMSSDFEVKVTYEDSTEEMNMKAIDAQTSQLILTPRTDLSGRWGVPFRLEPLVTDFGVLVVKGYDGETLSYSGRMFMYSWQIKADHVNNTEVYDVTLEYDFENESIHIVAGERTQGYAERDDLEFLITKVTDDTLISEPVNWENITRFPLNFSKDYDTVSILNNKQVMLKTVAESDDKRTISHE